MNQKMRLLTAEEIAEGWNIPVSTVREAWRSGALKYFIRRGNVRGRRSTAAWVNDWIENNAEGGSL